MKQIISFVFVFIFSTVVFAGQPANTLPEVQAFIDEMVEKHHFDRNDLDNMFSQVSINQEVIKRMQSPHEAKPWGFYRDFFVTPERIEKGVEYWNAHEKTLAAAEKKYGVPASIIVSIIGVETKYGENKGKFAVFDALTTLAFNGSPRSKYFKNELREFLLLSRENNLKPLLVQGSYAGAMGLPQFMPSSYRNYAVDFRNKGYSDLINNDDDAIVSVANYLKKHGWKPGEEVIIAAKVQEDGYRNYKRKSWKPKLTIKDLVQYGIVPKEEIDESKKAVYIRLENGDEDEHWLGFQNFYVITTYNNSALYAMAVNLLAEKIHERKSNKSQIS